MDFGFSGILQKTEAWFQQTIGCSFMQAVCILSVIIGVTCFLRRFRLSRKSLFSPHKLKILESKSLGNRQFLLIVGYENERLLLGVYPNGMRFLCKLGADKDIVSNKEPSHSNVPPL